MGEGLVLKEKGVRPVTTTWNRHLAAEHKWLFLAMAPASLQNLLEQARMWVFFCATESHEPSVAHCTEDSFFYLD